MNRRVFGSLVAGLMMVAAPAAQDVQLGFRANPQLVDCEDRVCFRMYVDALDSQGQPVELPDQAKFEVSESGRRLPVSATKFREKPTAGGESQTVVPRVTLVLFDTSGSMKYRLPSGETRFEAAKKTLAQLAESLRDGVDQMAIAPFDSIQVVARIRDAEFQTTRAGVQAQIDRLRLGANTALYSAVFEGLKKLEPKNVAGAQVRLVVFTDGKNDVTTDPHDAGLLGNNDRDVVVKRAREVGVEVFTIGFGTPGESFDPDALRALAYPSETKYFSASDAGPLKKIFATIEARGKTFVRLLVGPLPERREQLPRTLQFTVQTGQLTGLSPVWDRPAMGEPPMGDLTPDEKRELSGKITPPTVPSVVIRMIVLVAYSVLLAGLWFGLPRLIWPERYIPKPALQAGPARAGQRPAGRPAAHGSQPAGARPEVTLPPNRPAGRQGPAPPGRMRDPSPPPGRVREGAPPPRAHEPLGQRDAGDATVFIPPKKPGRDS